MSEYLINGATLTALADAIRDARGIPPSYADYFRLDPNTMIEDIQAIGASYKESFTVKEQLRTMILGEIEGDLTFNQVQYPRQYAFAYCNDITSLSLPGTISVSKYMCYQCYGLTSVDLPSVEYIGTCAFSGCDKLTSINAPKTYTIESQAFDGCKLLTSFTMSTNITTIEDNIFLNCDNLTTVTFKGTPTSINRYALHGAAITTINVPWAEGAVANAPWGATNATINYNYTGS